MSIDPRGIVMDANYVAGYDDGKEELKPELDRLRALNAEMREALRKLIPPGVSKYPEQFAPEWSEARAVLAKAESGQ